MRITLISSPTRVYSRPDFPPLGIAYLGAVAAQMGHEVTLIDAALRTRRQILRELQHSTPNLIGMTCWTVDRYEAWNLCNAILKLLPEVPLIVGGPHAGLYPDHIFQKTHACAVVRGEGERVFQDLLKVWDGKQPIPKVPGLVSRQQPNPPADEPSQRIVPDIDSIPFPYYCGFSDFSFRSYNGFQLLPGPTAAVISSRGCVFNCHYCSSCSFWGKRWRCRSARNVLDELQWLQETWGVRSIYFFDDNFPVDAKRVLTICESIRQRGWGLKWSCCSHVRVVNKNILQAMKASGCVSIDFGVESGSDPVLQNINKKQTSRDIIRAFDMTHEAGIIPRAYLMVGCPGENPSTIDQTVKLIGRIKPQASLGANVLWLLPGTRFYEQAVEKGVLDDRYWLENKDIPFNTMEHSVQELNRLRIRLLRGIARKEGTWRAWLGYLLKRMYYRFPWLATFRSSLLSKRFLRGHCHCASGLQSEGKTVQSE